MSAPLRLGPKVRAQLEGLRTRVRLALVGRGAARLVGVLLLACAISYALDRPLRLAWETRLAIFLLALGAAGWTAYRRLIRPLTTELPDVELARALERANPALRWRLLSAVQFSQDPPRAGTSGELSEAVVREAEGLAAGELDHAPAVPLQPVGKRVGLAALGLLLLGALVAGFPSEAQTWAERNLFLSKSARWPQDTYLELVSVNGRALSAMGGGPIRVPRGEDAEFAVEVARGLTPRRVYLIAEGLPGADAPAPFDDLGPGAKPRFRLVVERVPLDFQFWVEGGDSRIGPFQVKAVVPPFVEDLELKATPPAYTGLPSKTLKIESPSLSFPVGTELTLTARASKPLRKGWIDSRASGAEVTSRFACTLRSLPQASPEDTGPRVMTRTWTLLETTQLSLGVEDEDRTGLLQPPQFSVIAVVDREPSARLELSGVGLNVTKVAKIGYRIQGKDDYGLAAGALHVDPDGRPKPEKKAGEGEKKEDAKKEDAKKEDAKKEPPPPADEEQAIACAPPLAGKEAEASGVLDLSALKLEPTMSLRLWAEVRDGRPGDPQAGVSATIALRIVSEEQLLNELLRRLYEQRQVLEKHAREEDELARGIASFDEQALGRAGATHADVRRSLLRVSRAVEQVVIEMESNAILDEPTRERLRREVIQGLAELGKNELARAEATADALGREAPETLAERASDAAQASRDLADGLSAIADRIGRIEELAEIVAQLKRIIRRQRDLLDRTKKQKEGEK